MKLLREMMRLQSERGYLDDAALRELAAAHRVPLYRVEGLVSFYPAFRRTPPPRVTLSVCRDVCCAMAGAEAELERLTETLTDPADIEVHQVSCLGRCEHAPAFAVNEIPAAPVTLTDAEQLQEFLDRPAHITDEPTATPRRWQCDPYADPSARYSTVRQLAKQLESLPSNCIKQLTDSGLRGMGGAGFPTGKKWELVAAEPVSPKYVICNADESEPGTFKDRVVLEELPHLVIEGMLLAALCVGAEQGIVYLRHEYTRERKALQHSLDAAYTAGVLGENAAGSGRRFDIEIFVSPGGYILGEETALLEALEDKRGEPRIKPPYPGTHGLSGRPTLINNVETFAFATTIIHRGSEWWRSQGRGEFAGLKFVSVSGDVNSPGVYEVPVGITINEVIERAGGMRDGKELLAFLPGGASSNFLPASAAETPLEFDALRDAGSMLGTGAVIVMAEGRDLFALASNLVRFFRNESCGKCVPCRLGSEQAVQMLAGVQTGTLPSKTLEQLPPLGDTLEQTSICGLGQVALNPVLSMLRHFPDHVPS